MKLYIRTLIIIAGAIVLLFEFKSDPTQAESDTAVFHNTSVQQNLPSINMEQKVSGQETVFLDANEESPQTTTILHQDSLQSQGQESALQITEKQTEPIELPTSVNLDIPFYSQAPDGKRVLPRKEACEEASIVLGAYYLQGKSLSKEQFKADVLAITQLQQQLFDTYIDTTMAQLQLTYDSFYPGIGTTKVIENITVDDIKRELAQGNVVLAPFAGRYLDNPHYIGGGPRYHMMLIKGYDDKYFYTNDVGTSRGENYPYTYDTIINNIHDLVDGDIKNGPSRALVLIKNH